MLHLKSILNLLPNFQTSVRHSYDLAEILDPFKFKSMDHLYSYDVQSLFTRVPVNETLVIMRNRLDTLYFQNPQLLDSTTTMTIHGIMELLTYLLNDCIFIWSDRLYRQRSGLPMGSRLFPILASLFMEDLEQRSLAICPIQPRLYKRYVDDVIIIWDVALGTHTVLLDILNQQHPDIHLMVEEERNGSLPYLDLLITHPDVSRLIPWHYSLAIYRKPTHSNRYIHYKLAHPFGLKRMIFCSLWLWARRLLRNHPRQLEVELRYLHRTFSYVSNGYPDVIVRNWLKSFD